MQHHKSNGPGVEKVKYTLCTNHDGANSRYNRKLLEDALRLAYGYYPKGVKYIGEKHD